MTEPLRILHLEDSEVEATLVAHILRKLETDFTVRRVESRSGFLAGLAEFQPDLVLSDFKLPDFDGMQALEIVRERYPLIPFIFVTGSVGEDFAVEMLKKGAADYIIKDRLIRLPSAVQQALQRQELRIQRKQAEQALREKEAQLRSLGDNLPDGYIYQYVLLPDGKPHFNYVSAGVEKLHGLTPSQLMIDASLIFEQLDAEARRKYQEIEAKSARELSAYAGVMPFNLPGGQQRWVHIQSSPHRLADGSVVWDGVALDVTEQHLAQQKLAIDAEVFRQSREGIVITDQDAVIQSINQAFKNITGYSEVEAIGSNPRLLKSGRHEEGFYRDMWNRLLREGLWQGEIWNRRKGGEEYPEWLSITAVRNEDGEITNYIGVFSDLTQNKRLLDHLTHLAHYDAVTGLPNLFHFDDLFAAAIHDADQRGHGIAVVRMDIVNFQSMDVTHGMDVSAQALKAVAVRLAEATDNKGIATRLAKDSFTIAYPCVDGIAQATALAESLQKAMAKPLVLDHHEIHPDAKFGISFYPEDGATPRDLVQCAGIALSQVKGEKTASIRFFTKAMNDQMVAKITLISDIRKAIERQEFEMYYQPQIELASGKVIGLEALVRWNHPTQGFLLPSEFVSLAEESGLMLPLGTWIFKRVVAQMQEWSEAGQSDLSIAVAVNASALQMESGDLVDLLKQMFQESGLSPHSIELELTESLLVSNIGETRKLLQELKDMGISLSIDDFGTGYSSLSYLKQFSVDKLKIDKSFIDNVTTDPNDAVIVQATIAMAHSMGLKVIAEGVETEAQAHYLRSLQCDQIQGFYFSHPLPANEILSLLQKHTGARLKPVTEHQRVLLLVDDEPNVLASIKRILRSDGYQILTASSGVEGLEVLAQHAVGVIVSDQRMPEMSGVEFLSKAKLIHPDTMRIVLSGYTELNTITEAVNKGAVYKFLTKPWDDEELREVINRAFMHYEEKLALPHRQ